MARCAVGISLWNPVPQFCHRGRFQGYLTGFSEPLSEKELKAVRTSVDRGRPFNDDEWTEEMAETHGVWFTLRPIGRPRKKKKATPPWNYPRPLSASRGAAFSGKAATVNQA